MITLSYHDMIASKDEDTAALLQRELRDTDAFLTPVYIDITGSDRTAKERDARASDLYYAYMTIVSFAGLWCVYIMFANESLGGAEVKWDMPYRKQLVRWVVGFLVMTTVFLGYICLLLEKACKQRHPTQG